jgi:hypothetical protein
MTAVGNIASGARDWKSHNLRDRSGARREHDESVESKRNSGTCRQASHQRGNQPPVDG